VTVFPSNDFDFSSLSISPNDQVSFGARRLSDGAFVVGEIDTTFEEATILSEDLSDDVIQLVRVN
jgi:hypothetical protein